MHRSLRTSVATFALVAALTSPPVTREAQAAVAAAWSRDFGAPIRWQRVTALGQLLVCTEAGLFGVDPADGTRRWSQAGLGGLAADDFDEIEGSPLVVITSGRGEGSRRTVILNVFTGALVLDSRQAGLTEVVSTHVLPRSGSLLIAGFEPGTVQPMLFSFAMGDGRQQWKSDALSLVPVPGAGSGVNALMNLVLRTAIVATGRTPVQSAPLELDDGTFLLGAMGNLYRFDQASGGVLWKTPFAGGEYELRLAERRPGVAYVGAEETTTSTGADGTARESVQTYYQAFRLDDGAPVWQRPVRFSKPMNRLIIPLDDGLVVSEGDRDKGRIQLLDYDTGEARWGSRGKGIEIAGQVLDYAFAGPSLVLTAGHDSIWSNQDTEYLLYVLDAAAGVLRFAEPFEVKGRMLSAELEDYGLVYTTTHEINVFDPATGALLNPPVVRSKEPLAIRSDAAGTYAFNPSDGHVYRLDRASGAITRFSTEPFELPNDDSALSLDVLDGAVVLLGQQTIAGYGADGALEFSAHYPAPRDPAWVRSLAWAAGIRAGMASAYSGLYSAAAASAAADAEDGTLGDAVAKEMQHGFAELQRGYQGLATDYIGLARRHYQASAESRDFAFMMTQTEQRRAVLAQVSKRDGQIIAQIDMQRGEEPQYQVDDVSSRVFYQEEPSVITAYGFSPERVNVALR